MLAHFHQVRDTSLVTAFWGARCRIFQLEFYLLTPLQCSPTLFIEEQVQWGESLGKKNREEGQKWEGNSGGGEELNGKQVELRQRKKTSEKERKEREKKKRLAEEKVPKN